MNKDKLHVCYFGTYRANYSRNHIMRTGLALNGVEVTTCHLPLWYSIEDRVKQASGGWRQLAFWWRILRTYTQLLYKFFRHQPDFDVMVVGYPGQFDVFLAHLLCWWRGKPLVWDIFMSIYLIALERKLDRKSPFAVQTMRVIEKIACRLPDGLIMDTAAYAQWFEETHGISQTCFHLVPTGADSDTFKFLGDYQPSETDFQVVYCGTFIPNHGVVNIIEAARSLAEESSIHFTLIGEGPDYAMAVELAERYKLNNLVFRGWLSQDELCNIVAEAQLCLGVFGTTPQSLMTVQNKIYEYMALARPVLSGDSPTVRATFEHGHHLYLCERDDPQELSQAIHFLATNPQLCQAMAHNGHLAYQAHYSLEKIGVQFKQHLLKIVSRES